MKLHKIRITYLILLIFLILSSNAYSETSITKNIFDIQNGQIEITSISFEADMKDSSSSFISFSGDVSVTGNDMEMTCQELKLFFNDSIKDISGKDSKTDSDKVGKAIAIGSVVINIPEKGDATAEKAEYDYSSEKIVLTGNPVVTSVRKGVKYKFNGKELIWNVKEGRIKSEGTKEEKVGFTASGVEKR